MIIIKSFNLEKQQSYTFDFTNGIEYQGKLLQGSFDIYTVMFIGVDLCWIDIHREEQIISECEDGTFPIGGMGFVKYQSIDQHRNFSYKKLGKIQVYPMSKGILTIIIELKENYNKYLKS